MRLKRFVAAGAAITILLAGSPISAAQKQMPLAPASTRGQTVTPAFEGWYKNADGTFSISFGYYNRNREEALDIPLGDDNSMQPAHLDGAQPTHFSPRRHYGVFAVVVPADFGDGRVEWTLKIRGETFMIPGHLRADWEIDALEGEAGAGNTPPAIKFEATGPEGAGPLGVFGETLTTSAGHPLDVTVWAHDDGRNDPSVGRTGRRDVPVTVTWFKYQGPGDVVFGEASGTIPVAGGEMTTTATFSQPGEYILRVRANDASGVTGAGHAQCCWTNGFVKVTVTQ